MRKYDNFCKALENLKECRNEKEPYSTVVQTGIAALFEICFEQAWKAMKEILEEHGRTPHKIGSPKLIIKLAYNSGMINNSDLWEKLLYTRNMLSRTYSNETALCAIKDIKEKYIELFEELKAECDKNWI